MVTFEQAHDNTLRAAVTGWSGPAFSCVTDTGTLCSTDIDGLSLHSVTALRVYTHKLPQNQTLGLGLGKVPLLF